MRLMAKFDFPPLRLAALNALLTIKERMVADPQVLKSTDCPYDDETIECLGKILEVREVERVVERVVTVNKNERGRPRKVDGLKIEDLAELDDEVKGLLKSLREMDAMEGALETNERVQILKTKASLIEQALKNRERILNVKMMSEFQSTVIGILDDLIDDEGRDAFLTRIEPYRD